MVGSASLRQDASRLSKLDQQLLRLERWLGYVCGLAALSLIGLAVVSVGGRNLFNAPIPGYVDWIEQVMALIAFPALAYTQRVGGHIRMDIVIARLKGRALWGLETLNSLIMLLIVLLLVWGSWEHMARSFDVSAPLWSRDSSLDIRLPLWPAKLIVPVAFSVLAFRLAVETVAAGRAVFTGETHPVAFPLHLDAAETAALEAKSVSGARTADEMFSEALDSKASEPQSAEQEGKQHDTP